MTLQTPHNQGNPFDALVIGAGPAGLMAAQVLAEAGLKTCVADQMPAPARKLLMAGKSGLNLTMDAPMEVFLAAYGAGIDTIRPAVAAFGPVQVQDFARDLGQEVFTGSTGRVFPRVMKASPLLRAWLHRLDGLGVVLKTRWRFDGLLEAAGGRGVTFQTPLGVQSLTVKCVVLAMGGGSWARLGSDGAWRDLLAKSGVATKPFQPSNVGITMGWSEMMAKSFGAPLKAIAMQAGDMVSRGEAVISATGIEGGGLYVLGPALRAGAALHIDLMPDVEADQLLSRLARPRGKDSFVNHLRKALGLSAGKIALLQELARPEIAAFNAGKPDGLVKAIKGLNVPYSGLAPLDRAISTVGGVDLGAIDETYMLSALPGVFCAGEMLDWDAPTGGYLITACLATGRAAGLAAADWAAKRTAR